MRCDLSLGVIKKNIGTMLLGNSECHGHMPAFAEKVSGKYKYWMWNELISDVTGVIRFLTGKGLKPGDRVAFLAGNSYRRLVAELAVMSSGMTSVPVFAGYSKGLICELIKFSDVSAVVVDGYRYDAADVPLVFDLRFFDDMTKYTPGGDIEHVMTGVDDDSLAVIMFTSGTSGSPKGVQLTHANLMSQQKALKILWAPEPGMRFLCYLPWHHSFGGLFERFFALSSGGCLAVDDSGGKNVDKLLENYLEIKPNIFFSVPKIYQEITARMASSKAVERGFFHDGLKFIFTAAAPLPLSTSEIFKAKKVPVIEGWGLTETSPCCTLTSMDVDRKLGVVGFPMPGVEVKIGEENEILVRGPNVMKGYFKQPEATARVLDNEGWFKTGDIGEITEDGLRIISRKDRMFKLSNGEKIFPSVIEENLKAKCRFIKHAYVFGQGQSNPLAIIFPNTELIEAARSGECGGSGCSFPACLNEFARCLGKCIVDVNHTACGKIDRVQKVMIVDTELTIERNELTPSFKLIPKRIEENFRTFMHSLEVDRINELPGNIYVVELAAESVRRK
ncbi:MAG: AMP-binding protein [Bdellovibrionota bacterium]